jgi:hypothetical protein
MEMVAGFRLSKDAVIDIAFFCGVPLGLAALSVLLGPYAAILGWMGASVYVVCLAVVPWWLTAIATYLIGGVAHRKLPFWLIAALGAIAAGPVVTLYALVLKTLLAGIWPGLNQLLQDPLSLSHLQSAALSEGRAIVLWIAFVAIFRETLGWQRLIPNGSGSEREDRPATNGGPDREDRFQLAGADWSIEDDQKLRTLVEDGLLPRAIAAEMKRTLGGIRARTTKLGLRNNRPNKPSATSR